MNEKPILHGKCCCGLEFDLRKTNWHFLSAKSGGTLEELHAKLINAEEATFFENYFMGCKCPRCHTILSVHSISKHISSSHCKGEGSLTFNNFMIEIYDRSTNEVVSLVEEQNESSSDADTNTSSSSSAEEPAEKKLKLDNTKPADGNAKHEATNLVSVLTSMGFDEKDAQLASKYCSTADEALNFLNKQCPLCLDTVSADKMISMLRCVHSCCITCAKTYFTTQIREKFIMSMTCMFCNEPVDLGKSGSQDDTFKYFSEITIFLKTLLSENVYDLFEEKMRDFALMNDSNFLWCIKVECGSGYIAIPNNQKTTCPHCGTVTCKVCRRQWSEGHVNKDCDTFAKDLKDEDKLADDQILLAEIFQCPNCESRFSLSQGGCMHLQCTFCKHDFCSGCAEPFLVGSLCKFAARCRLLGLHCHHHRNCMYYLRDKSPEQLEHLLQTEMIDFGVDDLEYTDSEQSLESKNCKISLQMDTPLGLVEGQCKEQVVEGYAGYCIKHYVEYLCGLIKKHELDPSIILTVEELEATLARFSKDLPPRNLGLPEDQYRTALIEAVSSLPLKPRP